MALTQQQLEGMSTEDLQALKQQMQQPQQGQQQQQQPQGFLPRVGAGLQAGLQALPSILLEGKAPAKDKASELDELIKLKKDEFEDKKRELDIQKMNDEAELRRIKMKNLLSDGGGTTDTTIKPKNIGGGGTIDDEDLGDETIEEDTEVSEEPTYVKLPTGKTDELGRPEYKYELSQRSSALQKGQESAIKKKYDKMAESEIAMSSLSPKIGYMMSLGSRAYKELKREADKLNIKLDFESGGLEFWKSRAVKAGLNINRLTPLMEAVTRLRPEIGFEVMRQIGPFRSAHAGLIFTETLPAFEGHIPSDISKSVSTMTKSFVGALGNKELVMEVFGKELSREEQVKMGQQYEANLLRSYNKMYRSMGVTTKFYDMGYTIEDIAENSKFTNEEEELIGYYSRENPDRDRDEIVITLIDEGKL